MPPRSGVNLKDPEWKSRTDRQTRHAHHREPHTQPETSHPWKHHRWIRVQWAKDCPPAAIALACSATPKERQRLHAQPTGAKTRSLAYAATRVGSVPSRTRIIRESAAKLAVALLLIVLGLPIWKFDALDNPWTWVAFAGLAIGTLPFGALRDLVGATRRDATAQLVIHHATEPA